jgi:uncharacterized membrane protein
MAVGEHHHDHSADAALWSDMTAEPVRRRLAGVVIAVGLATILGLVIFWPRGELKVDRSTLGFGAQANATVTGADIAPCSYDDTIDCNTVTFEITSGPAKGTTTAIEADLSTRTPASTLDEGDKIVVNDGGEDLPPEARFSFADIQRGPPLILLAIVFAVAVVALGRLRGLLALAGIAVSFGVLLVFVFPALLHGSAPIGVALTGSAVIAYITLYLAHGVNVRTTVALLGTLAALALTAVLAVAFAGGAHLTGLASEESVSLLAFAPDLDFRGLLLAAVILGALGVLDDVTITQVSAVAELHAADPRLGPRQLYAAGIRIGRDHIASTVNTLVLAYTAAALPLLLLFTQSGRGLGSVLASETVAVEVVQTLVGSIGLVASVPLTTALACWVIGTADATAAADHVHEPDGFRDRPGVRDTGDLYEAGAIYRTYRQGPADPGWRTERAGSAADTSHAGHHGHAAPARNPGRPGPGQRQPAPPDPWPPPAPQPRHPGGPGPSGPAGPRQPPAQWPPPADERRRAPDPDPDIEHFWDR